MKDYFKQKINRVAEIHYYLRPVLSRALEQQKITDEGRKIAGNYKTYKDIWEGSFSDKFFDMTTMIFLGSTIEVCLKEYYMDKKGYTKISELKDDPKYKHGIFQRFQSSNRTDVVTLYKEELNYDLLTNPHFASIQEAMQHRHLYAHNSGVIDDQYIQKIVQITGQDISLMPEVANSYRQKDTYWFKPLRRLNYFIDETRMFFSIFV
ncbi:MAG: hypothetical protein QNJ36_11270 [Calothrix sp. MO_167.B42]|nr:hypothetical protein [Calothrix sp. MO_167.B42]